VLSGGRDIITLGEEMHNVELYLQIIRVSRSEPFRLNIVCPDDSVLLYPIPKLTLQPFVENTVKHGFRGTESDELSVTIHEEDCYLSIVIEDNGIGVEQEVLNEAMCEDCDEHFGITSVRRRMQLLCGEDYSMSAESRPGEGTRVILRYHASELSVGEEARPIAP
jgi:two-component system sensor histidine kinase YesM